MSLLYSLSFKYPSRPLRVAYKVVMAPFILALSPSPLPPPPPLFSPLNQNPCCSLHYYLFAPRHYISLRPLTKKALDVCVMPIQTKVLFHRLSLPNIFDRGLLLSRTYIFLVTPTRSVDAQCPLDRPSQYEWKIFLSISVCSSSNLP